MSVAAILLLVLEAVALLLLAVAILRVLRARRRDRPSTGDLVEDSLAALVPRRVARLVALEIHGWSALMTVSRRWRRPPADSEFSYSRGLRMLMSVLLAWVVIEVPLLVFIAQLLIPWGWSRLALLLVGLYAVWWVASTWASFITLPHAIHGGALHLHVGALARMIVPLVDVADVSRLHRAWNHLLGPSVEGGTVGFPIGGETAIRIRLLRPSKLRRIFGRDLEAAAIHVQVDDADRMLTALSRALTPEKP